MKHFHIIILAVLSSFFCHKTNAQNPLTFTAVMDMSIPSGSGKAVMLTANQSISDLSEYSIKSYFNGSSTSGNTFNLPAKSISTGQHLLLCADSAGLSSYFDGCLEQFSGALMPTLFHESSFPNTNGNDALELVDANGSDIASESSLFGSGPNATWTHVYTSCQLGDGNNGAAQSFSINVTSLPSGGANYRVVKSVANGNWFNANAQPLQLGLNNINVSSVSFDRAVKFQFNSGDVEFDLITSNGSTVYTNSMEIYGVIGDNPDTQGNGCNTPSCWDTEDAWAWKDTAAANVGNWVYADVDCSDNSSTTQTSSCPFPLCAVSPPSSPVLQDFANLQNTAVLDVFGGFGGGLVATNTLEDDPVLGSSNMVRKATQSAGGDVWKGVFFRTQTNYIDLTNNQTVSIDVYSTTATHFKGKIQVGKSGQPADIELPGSVAHSGSGWETLSFDFTGAGNNFVLAYTNFNYQGTDVSAVDASNMEYLHVDVFCNADPASSIIQVSPISNGEYLVTIPHTQGSWTSIDIPVGDFVGMTLDNVVQMKFAANGAGSTTPIDVYLDNIYFWKQSSSSSTIDVTFEVNTANIYNNSDVVGPNGIYVGGGVVGDAQAIQLTQSASEEPLPLSNLN